MKQLFIILVLFVTNLGGSKNSLAQGFPGVECLNCCAVIGQGQNQCRVVCTEQKYTLTFFTGAISGPCVFPAQSGVTATLVSSGNGMVCVYDVVVFSWYPPPIECVVELELVLVCFSFVRS